ncbi:MULTISPECIES: thiomuracin/GE37468 family thiazolyl RiPP peptide [Microtetraspora]|uniref:Thiomuracin/GE37468 family thiazolyl RiPP peptide n=1 Tax=Microtetraspora glauca TaxID=1996 RepID=A0ABV3G8C0_MICGL|nr:thiomuracin/GE37468 family thiazolyl RiPP peptide [Microtetraspora sp. AC03309]MCC5579620.1 GE37468 family thiazolyl peptide [Microtetraspora sp. AC03309]
MGASKALDFDLENLPMDVFELADSGLTIESLTAGHGLVEGGASGCALCSCSIACSSSSSS